MKGEDLGRIGRRLLLGAWKKGRDAVGDVLDADRMLQRSMAALVETAAARYPIDAGHQWRPGSPLELLLVGYAGTRNTGADVRVEEMIRQFRHLFGDDHLALSVTTLNPDKTRGYFNGVRQLEVPSIFPKFLADAVHIHHGVVACEGSMFKSKFASALTTFMAGAIGLARAEQKLAIGYGGEAGTMDPELEKFVRKVCGGSLVIARNEASVDVLGRLGIPARLGTDTAWTFEPERPELGAEILRHNGWDGVRPVLVVCPINPYWWPVKPDVAKGLEYAITRAHAGDHFRSLYFHKGGPEVERAQAKYLDALAGPIRRAAEKYGAFVALVGMEALDRKACEALRERLSGLSTGTPALIVSDDYPLQSMVSVLWKASAMVSSRYHAIVTSMGGGVPSLGVTMDERIRNLMTERGQTDLLLEVDQPDLETALDKPLARLFDDPDGVRVAMRKTVAKNLRVMGTMGMTLVEAVRKRHPAMPIREGLGEIDGADPMAHLPRLGPAVTAIAREVVTP